jgi:decaprenylphospho-beta-D-erythro-pentofuranosid-2-ulose 2-reductase
MIYNKRIVIVGATSAIAEQCARLWGQQQQAEFVLIGRSTPRVERVAADMRVRNPGVEIRVVQSDFLDASAIESVVERIFSQGKVDIVLIAQGALPDQDACQHDLVTCRDALEINALSPVLFAEAFAKHLSVGGGGTIALIGSVAGDRGRKSNYVYGAAKSLVACYAQGLQHRFFNSGVRVVLIKPGPTDTPMTAHLKGLGHNLAPVEVVAKEIVEAVESGKTEVYTPMRWLFIMRVIRWLPAWIFNKLNI